VKHVKPRVGDGTRRYTAALNGRTSLAFLQAVYCNDGLPLHVRMKAAIAALPFEHPKLSATLAVQADDSFAAGLQAAIARSNAVDKQRAIEHQPAVPASNGHAVHDSAAEVSTAASARTGMVSYRRR
jgi:hypothetical protein